MDTQLLEVVMSTDCTCEEYDEITDTSYPADWCIGCWEDNKFIVESMVFEWRRRNNYDGDYVGVDVERMLWTNISLKTAIPLEKLFDFLSLKGDYTLYFKLDDKTLTVRRTSHDEPMGAYFLIRPLEVSDFDSDDE